MSLTVMEVSAMLVANTIFRTPSGGCWNMAFWSIMGILECTGGQQDAKGLHTLFSLKSPILRAGQELGSLTQPWP